MVKLKELMVEYQDLVNSSCLLLFEFQGKTFKALNNQKKAIELYQAKEFKECNNRIKRNKVLILHLTPRAQRYFPFHTSLLLCSN